MHVVIATDGHLDPALAAEMATRLAGPDGAVTIVSIVQIMRNLLNDLREAYGRTEETTVIIDRDTVSVQESHPAEHSPWPGDDAMIARYLRDEAAARTDAIADALRGLGLEPAIDVREGEAPAADIVALLKDSPADVLIVGSRGGGFFDGLLGSTSTKLVRQAPCPVLVIRHT